MLLNNGIDLKIVSEHLGHANIEVTAGTYTAVLDISRINSLRDGETLPTPSALDTIQKDDEYALVNLVCINLDEYARTHGDKAVKKTLSIPAWLNTACERIGVNYSKVLQDALIAKLQVK